MLVSLKEDVGFEPSTTPLWCDYCTTTSGNCLAYYYGSATNFDNMERKHMYGWTIA